MRDDLDEEFADFVRRYDKRLRGFLRAYGTTEESIDAAAQHAFLVVGRRWSRLRRPGGNPKAYLFRVGLNEVHKQNERASRQVTAGARSLEELATDLPDAQDQVVDLISQMDLTAMLKQLPDRQREVIVCRFVRGWSVAETAKSMGISAGTVKSCTSDAIRNLRKLLGSATNAGEADDR